MTTTTTMAPYHLAGSLTVLACLLAYAAYRRTVARVPVPVSVNYFFTRRGLGLLKRAGMLKLNIAGGEPFLYPKFPGTGQDGGSHAHIPTAG
ncbi:hypothetical protein CDD83_891 [Cordyceps sp. RAO-2017]|nr:hypothetical protein CDD83_891 [Cordyceps sp. RAO-2017]